MADDDTFGGLDEPSNVIPFPAMRPNAKLSEAWAKAQKDQNDKLQVRDEFLSPIQCVDQIIRRRSLPRFQWPAAWPQMQDRCRAYAGDVVAVTGPTGAGKTSFAVQVLLAHIGAGIPGLWAPLELSPTELTERAVANMHGIHTMVVKELWGAERIKHSLAAVSDMWHFIPRIMDVDAQMSVIRRGIHLVKRTYRVAPLVVIDYLGKLSALSRDIRLATIQAAELIRALAVEEECYILMLAQPSRAKNKELTGKLEHESATETSGAAAESGEVENASAVEVNLEVFKEDDAESLDARWHVAKSRHVGREGQVGARFSKPGGVWSELDYIPAHPLRVKTEMDAQKKDKHRTEAPQSKGDVRKALNVSAAGDAAAIRRVRLFDAIRERGIFGLEEHAMRTIPGVGRGLALAQDLQELERRGAIARLPGRRWQAVT